MSSAILLGSFAFTALIAFPLRADEVTLSGRVVDENSAPVPAARVNVRPTVSSTIAASGKSWEVQTDPTGAFTLTLPEPGDYLVGVTREG
jgi:hypothetical protein